MGLAERMGAVAVDRGRRADQLWAEPARRNDRLPVDGQRLAGLSPNRQTRGKIRRDRNQPGGRGRRVSNPGRLWLDQWRDAEAYGALPGRSRSDERRPLSQRRSTVRFLAGGSRRRRRPRGDQAGQIPRPLDAPRFHDSLAAARVDLMGRKVAWAEAGALVDLLRHQYFAAERLGQRLEAGGDVDRIADHGELRMALVADRP